MKDSIRKLSRDKVRLLCVVFALIAVVTACSPSPPTSPSKSNPTFTPTSALTNQQPIEIVSLFGPIPPINPGGPNVELVLRNISSEAIMSLSVTLELNRPFNFVFDVSLPVPLFPGKTISSEQTLIGAGFNESTNYPLKISGTFRNGPTFDYVIQVQIKPYPTKNS